MNPIIRRLRAEHQGACHLLRDLDHQLRAFEQNRPGNVWPVLDIVEALNRYLVGGWDGQRAELMDALARADRRFAPARLVLTTESGVIRELGEHCIQCINDILSGSVLLHSELLIPYRRYLRRYRSHLERERRYLVGMAAAPADGSEGSASRPSLVSADDAGARSEPERTTESHWHRPTWTATA